MMSRVRSIARVSAVKMELSIGRDFLIIVLFKTACKPFCYCPWSHLLRHIGGRDGVGGYCEISPDK